MASPPSPSPLTRARVLSVQVGTVADLPFAGRTVRSAIGKRRVDGPVGAGPLGLDGDEQGDRAHHGGPDKAICVFPREHYGAFERRLGRLLAPPAFGENLTTSGLREADVCVGDRLRIGTAVCEVSSPRNPCFRPGALHGDKRVVLWMEESGETGFYLRVLEPGELAAGDAVELLERPHPEASVAEANRVMHHDRHDREALEALLALPSLGASWRRTFERRRAGEVEDPSRRRFGPAEGQSDGARLSPG